MATKSKSTASVIKFQPKPKVKRKGIVAKTKTSKIKSSINIKHSYRKSNSKRNKFKITKSKKIRNSR
jgi:hypothetical protein